MLPIVRVEEGVVTGVGVLHVEPDTGVGDRLSLWTDHAHAQPMPFLAQIHGDVLRLLTNSEPHALVQVSDLVARWAEQANMKLPILEARCC